MRCASSASTRQRIPKIARKKGDVLAYAELHIEQGPVLEAEGLAVGVVTAINGFSRLRVTLRGAAGHAGTVPMNLRRDALAGAAECVLAVERIAQRASRAGRHGRAHRSEARRDQRDSGRGDVHRRRARAAGSAARAGRGGNPRARLSKSARSESSSCEIENLQDFGVTACAPRLMAQMDRAVASQGFRVRRLPSGAGHDGMALGAITDICMLFVRCKGGISHNPLESITEDDAAAGACVF